MPRVGNEVVQQNHSWISWEASKRPTMMFLDRAMPANGWITGFAVRVGARDSAQAPVGRLVLYVDSGRVHLGPETTYGPPAFQAAAGLAVRATQNQRVRPGVWGKPTGTLNDGEVAARSGGVLYQTADSYRPTSAPASYPAVSQDSGELAAYFDYVANVAPLKGTWRTAPTGEIVDTTPIFEGDLLHPASEGGRDSSTRFQLLIWPEDDPTNPIHNQWLTTTAAEKAQGYFSRSPVTIPAGVNLKARFVHEDSWGVRSPNSDEISFFTGSGPSAPVPIAPAGKINQQSGYSYTATYDHPSGTSANAARVRVLDSTGNTLLYDSDWVSQTVAPSGTLSVAEFHANPAWGTALQWQMAARSTDGGISAYSAKIPFRTNSPPNTPTNLSPSEGRHTPSRVFSAAVSDPDGDPITAAEIEIVDVASGLVVAGYPKAMTVSGSTATHTATATDLPLNASYRYRVRATDGLSPGYGSWSGYVTFVLADVPVVTPLAPHSPRRNLIPDPSFEHADSGYWTETARVEGVDHADRAEDENARVGGHVGRATCSVTGDNRLLGAAISVDPAKPVYALAALKEVSGDSSAHFALRCLDSGDTLLGTVYPQSVALANATNVPPSWTEYGGIVWPVGSTGTPALPAGTASVRPEITPSRESAAVVDVDAVFLDQPPAGIAPADWDRAQPWHGYADGDGNGYGEAFGVGGYVWEGTPGASSQRVLPVLTGPGAVVRFAYSHGSASPKTADKLVVERWDGSGWAVTHDSGWVTSSRTAISLPSGSVANEGRYAVTVHARDSIAGEGETDRVEFDVAYAGPPEPVILVRRADPERGELVLEIEPSTLSELEFAGRELEVWATDGSEGPPKTVEVVLDRTATRVVYPFPVAYRPYRLGMRDAKNVGAERVESRRVFAEISCDYDHVFLKDVLDPENLFVAYDTSASNLPTPAHHAPYEGLETWDGPVEVYGTARWRSGQETAEIFEDVPGAAPSDERYDTLMEILKRRGTVCLMHQAPKRGKVFARVVTDPVPSFEPPRLRRVVFGWREANRFSEEVS